MEQIAIDRMHIEKKIRPDRLECRRMTLLEISTQRKVHLFISIAAKLIVLNGMELAAKFLSRENI